MKKIIKQYKQASFLHIIAPILSPVILKGQLIGISHKKWLPILEQLIKYKIHKGYLQRAFLVAADNGLDELSSCSDADISFINKDYLK